MIKCQDRSDQFTVTSSGSSDAPPPHNFTKLLFCGFRRGGSSVTFKAISEAFVLSGHLVEDIVQQKHLEQGGIPHVTTEDLVLALDKARLVGCFRSPPPETPLSYMAQVLPVAVVRDPRDCLLSWFHAAKLHNVDVTLESVFCDHDFVQHSLGVVEYCAQRGGLIFKYEDIIVHPTRFLATVFGRLSCPINREALDWAAATLSFLQIANDSGSHNRLGLPYAEFLGLESKARRRLNLTCEPLLQALQYPLEPVVCDYSQRAEIDSLKRLVLKLAEENALRTMEIEQLRGASKKLAARERSTTRTKPRPRARRTSR